MTVKLSYYSLKWLYHSLSLSDCCRSNSNFGTTAPWWLSLHQTGPWPCPATVKKHLNNSSPRSNPRSAGRNALDLGLWQWRVSNHWSNDISGISKSLSPETWVSGWNIRFACNQSNHPNLRSAWMAFVGSHISQGMPGHGHRGIPTINSENDDQPVYLRNLHASSVYRPTCHHSDGFELVHDKTNDLH